MRIIGTFQGEQVVGAGAVGGNLCMSKFCKKYPHSCRDVGFFMLFLGMKHLWVFNHRSISFPVTCTLETNLTQLLIYWRTKPSGWFQAWQMKALLLTNSMFQGERLSLMKPHIYKLLGNNDENWLPFQGLCWPSLNVSTFGLLLKILQQNSLPWIWSVKWNQLGESWNTRNVKGPNKACCHILCDSRWASSCFF